ncbi:unnamed protein product [Haemonchus placei]|uniref:Uncharacterized protein n=1 Tax=Haemonchus placei TaxID=6290 RepID=A0A3P7U492_HAEPC|nr:unnamed protein product [Haemonchus placei]
MTHGAALRRSGNFLIELVLVLKVRRNITNFSGADPMKSGSGIGILFTKSVPNNVYIKTHPHISCDDIFVRVREREIRSAELMIQVSCAVLHKDSTVLIDELLQE